jgi:hypothetical protein
VTTTTTTTTTTTIVTVCSFLFIKEKKRIYLLCLCAIRVQLYMQQCVLVCGILRIMSSLKNEWIDKCIYQLPLCSFFWLAIKLCLWKIDDCVGTFRICVSMTLLPLPVLS